MSIEAFFVDYLSSRLNVPVSGDIPSPRPPAFVTVEQTGSSHLNHVNRADLVVQSWAESRAEAIALNLQVVDAMEAACEEAMISRCQLESYYNFPDLSTKSARYQAAFEVVHFF